MSRDPNREASDIDPHVGKPLKKAPPKPPTAAELEAEWVQAKNARPRVQVNVRTKMWRYVP